MTWNEHRSRPFRPPLINCSRLASIEVVPISASWRGSPPKAAEDDDLYGVEHVGWLSLQAKLNRERLEKVVEINAHAQWSLNWQRKAPAAGRTKQQVATKAMSSC